jgi:hypothetical protein
VRAVIPLPVSVPHARAGARDTEKRESLK